MTERLLTPAELETHWRRTLKISRKTLANWRIDPEGRGPDFRKIGGRIFYPLSAVEHFEARGEHRSPKGGFPSQAEATNPTVPLSPLAPVSRNGRSVAVHTDSTLAALQAEIHALDLRRNRLAAHYRSQLARTAGRQALRSNAGSPTSSDSL